LFDEEGIDVKCLCVRSGLLPISTRFIADKLATLSLLDESIDVPDFRLYFEVVPCLTLYEPYFDYVFVKRDMD